MIALEFDKSWNRILESKNSGRQYYLKILPTAKCKWKHQIDSINSTHRLPEELFSVAEIFWNWKHLNTWQLMMSLTNFDSFWTVASKCAKVSTLKFHWKHLFKFPFGFYGLQRLVSTHRQYASILWCSLNTVQWWTTDQSGLKSLTSTIWSFGEDIRPLWMIIQNHKIQF